MSEAETIAKLALKGAAKPEVVTHGDRAYIVVPEGFKHHDISHAPLDAHGLIIEPPTYVKQHVQLQTVDSLVEYVARFKGESTVLFANIDSSSITAVIDYHEKAHTGEIVADHAAHRAKLTLPYALEWKIWTDKHERLMPQLDFARFIEENAADISAPPAADLFESIRDLQAHRKVDFRAAVRTASSSESFEYSEDTKTTSKSGHGNIEIPTRFTLQIPVYFGEPATELGAFLRWELTDAKLFLGIALHRAEHVRQAVFKQIVTSVSERAECPAVFGAI